MSETAEFTRKRSAFWMRVNENDDGGYNFYVSEAIRPVFDYHFSEVSEASPTGWKDGKSNTENIWVPENRSDQIDVDKIKEWAEFAGNQCVWLTPSKHIAPHFVGNEIDYCIAADFNFTTDGAGNIGGRSDLGEAERQLKYHFSELNENQQEAYCAQMSEVLLKIIVLLPTQTNGKRVGFGLVQPPIVSPIPAQKDSSGLAWVFAEHVAEQRGLQFMEPHLLVPKPKMKELPISKKIETWDSIYATPKAVDIDPQTVKGRAVIVVDDLYQSGVTIWAYAKFLKGIGARRVYGLACVKSMKDTDNQ